MTRPDVKTVPMEPTTVRDYADRTPALGPVVMVLPEGPALCHDTRSCTIITGERPSTDDRFVVIISVAEVDAEAIGTLAQFTPDQARSFAASLIASANECDGGQRGTN